MLHPTRLLLICLALVLLAPIQPAAPAHAAPITQTSPLPINPSELVPLPRSCGGGLPPGVPTPVCCAFGYVLIDGKAVAGAQVTISGPRGKMTVWTAKYPDSPLPYYRVSLSDAPLGLQENEQITIKANYNNHEQTLTHTVLKDGQQIDVVLPRNQPDDFVFDRQILALPETQKFNQPLGVAIDGADNVYVVDSDHARVLVFTIEGKPLYQWGAPGKQPGQFSAPRGVAVDRRGNVYVVDTGNHRVQKFTSTGQFLMMWGSEGSEIGKFRSPGGVFAAADGTVYVADRNNHRIQRFNQDGAPLAPIGGEGTGNGQFLFPDGVAVGADGTIYVADTSNNRVQKLAPDGTYQHAWGGYGGGAGQFFGPSGIVVDSAGNVYVADLLNGRVQKFSANGDFVRAFGEEGFNAGQLNYPYAVALDSAGALYVADSGNNRIQPFGPDGLPKPSWGAPYGEGIKLDTPVAGVVDPNGVVYVADSSLGTIQTLSLDGGWRGGWGARFANLGPLAADSAGNIYVSNVARRTITKYTGDGAPVREFGGLDAVPPEAGGLSDIAVDGAGNLYAAFVNENASGGNGSIVKWDANGAAIATWNADRIPNRTNWDPRGITVDKDGNLYVVEDRRGLFHKFGGDGRRLGIWGAGPGTGNNQFNRPRDIGVDTNGNIYVVDTGNHRIQKFNAQGVHQANLGGLGSGDGQFADPINISIGPDNGLYVIDAENFRVQKFNADGAWQWQQGSRVPFKNRNRLIGVTVSSDGMISVVDGNNRYVQTFNQAGGLEKTWGNTAEPGKKLVTPRGIAQDKDGTFYITDTGDDTIKVYNKDGTWRTTWGGRGRDPGQFRAPMGVAVDQAGNIYVADTYNHRIQKYSGGQWTTAGFNGVKDGQFRAPHGIAVDSRGVIYVADTNNARVQTFSPDMKFLKQWPNVGNAASPYAGPIAISVDGKDNVYIVENYAYQVQKFSSDGRLQTSVGGFGEGDGQFAESRGVFVDGNGTVYVSDSVRNRVQALRPQTYTRPIATIAATSLQSVPQGVPVELLGKGSDSDKTAEITGYEWSLNGAPFADSADATLRTDTLEVGRHDVAFRVRDSEGEFSDPQVIQVEIQPPPEKPIDTWALLLYLDADTGQNDGLENALSVESSKGALFRLKNIPSNPAVPVVALYDGPGNNDSQRFVIADGKFLSSTVPEANMGDPNTLVEFVQTAQRELQTKHYYLSIADHGNALGGLAWDITSGPKEHLTFAELREAMLRIADRGAYPIDILHLDVCSLGSLETAYQLRGLAKYVIASESIAWSAFAYELYRGAVGARTTPEELARQIVDSYEDRITESVVEGNRVPYTIAAFNMAQLDQVTVAVDKLAGETQRFALASADNRATLTTLRSQAQTIDTDDNPFKLSPDEPFVDLRHWGALLESGVSDDGVRQTAAGVRAALDQFIIDKRSASGLLRGVNVNLDNAHGLSIFYPTRAGTMLYTNYTRGDFVFPYDTRWDEYLSTVLPGQAALNAAPNITPIPPLQIGATGGMSVYLPMTQR